MRATPHAGAHRQREAPEYVSVSEAARIAGLTERTILEHLRAGTLPGGRLGSGKGSPWRIRRTALLELLDGTRHEVAR